MTESPLDMHKMIEEFKERIGSKIDGNYFCSFLGTHWKLFSERNDIDLNTKAKYAFGLGRHVNLDLLGKFHQIAVVRTDEQDRIIFYESFDGRMKFQGNVFPNDRPYDKDFIKFLNEKCEKIEKPLSQRETVHEYIAKTGSQTPSGHLCNNFAVYSQSSAISTKTDINEMVKLMFGLGTRVSSEIQAKLSLNGTLIVERGQIIFYESFDGSLKLQGEHGGSEKKADQKRKSTENGSENDPKRQKASEIPNVIPKMEPIDEIICSPPETEEEPVNSTGNSTSQQVILPVPSTVPSKELVISQKKILESLHSLIISLDLKSLGTLQSQIESKLNDCTENLPINLIQMALDPFLSIIIDCPMEMNEESFSLKVFLWIFKQFVNSLKLSNLDDFRQKLDGIYDSAVDKNISVKKIKWALSIALAFFSP